MQISDLARLREIVKIFIKTSRQNSAFSIPMKVIRRDAAHPSDQGCWGQSERGPAMARAEAASASARSDSIKGLAQSIAKPAYRRLLTAEPALRRAVPALIIAFLLTICVGAFVQILDHRRQTIAELARQTRRQRRRPGRTHRPRARRQERFRSPPAGRARSPAAALGARARPPAPRHQCRRRDHRRRPPRACQQP